jgi:hypothetical protein
MLDNVVSPITCISMNHQNQLEQMENGVMFATKVKWTNLPESTATWEDYNVKRANFQMHWLGDKQGGSHRPPTEEVCVPSLKNTCSKS